MIITADDDEASVIDIFLPKLTQADPGPGSVCLSHYPLALFVSLLTLFTS